MYLIHLYRNVDILSSCFSVLMSEGCKWSISNHAAIVFDVKTVNWSFLPRFSID